MAKTPVQNFVQASGSRASFPARVAARRVAAKARSGHAHTCRDRHGGEQHHHGRDGAECKANDAKSCRVGHRAVLLENPWKLVVIETASRSGRSGGGGLNLDADEARSAQRAAAGLVELHLHQVDVAA
jgi:hypothetical protein